MVVFYKVFAFRFQFLSNGVKICKTYLSITTVECNAKVKQDILFPARIIAVF